MNQPNLPRWALPCMAVLSLMLTGGCSGLLPKGPPPPLVYALDGSRDAFPTMVPVAESTTAPTLIINPPSAAPGYDTRHIVYVQVAYQLQHFARSEWVAPPARMLLPIMVSAIENTGSFRAVGPVSSGIAGDLRLDTEILRLHQEFGGGPSRVRFTLRVTLSDKLSRQVNSWRQFDETVVSASDDTYGGVAAANRAVQLVMQQLAAYCTLTSKSWQASRRKDSKPTEQMRSLN